MKIFTIKDGMTTKDIDVMKPFRQPATIDWCEECSCFRKRNSKRCKEQHAEADKASVSARDNSTDI